MRQLYANLRSDKDGDHAEALGKSAIKLKINSYSIALLFEQTTTK